MAIMAYTGLQGSGKSYEVVSHVIVRAVASGRRVVSNIEGLQPEAIRDYVLFLRGDASGPPLGDVVLINNDAVSAASFFPVSADDQTSFVKAGDLVAIDEAWRFWGKEFQLYRPHVIFFREHRHFVHPQTGVSCDLVLISQSIDDFNPMLRKVIKQNFLTEKKSLLGMNKTYSLKTFDGHRQARAALIRTETKKYNPKIFPLYSSYQGGQGKEEVVDARGNVFSSWPVRFGIVAVPLLLVLCIYFLIGTFSRLGGGDSKQALKDLKNKHGTAAGIVVDGPAPSPVSSWYIAGQAKNDYGLFVVLKDDRGILRLEPAKSFTFINGKPVSGLVDGFKVGAFPSGGGLSPFLKSETKTFMGAKK
jgi:zona occludens toxin